MNPPQVYMCSPSWTLLPPPSPYHPSGSSQCSSPKHPVSCIEPGLASHFIHDILHVSMPFSQSIFFFFLAVPHSMWELSSPTRDWICAPCNGRQRVLTTGQPRKFWCLLKDRYQTHWRGTCGEGNGKGVQMVMTHLRMNTWRSHLCVPCHEVPGTREVTSWASQGAGSCFPLLFLKVGSLEQQQHHLGAC